MRGEIVIAAVGHTAFGKLPGRSTISMTVEATRKALASAGLEKDIIDAVVVKAPSSAPKQVMYGQKLSEALGLQPKFGFSIDQGGAANLTALTFAALAIEAGQCEVAMVGYADNPRSGSRAHFARPRGNDAAFGWFSTVATYGMIHRRHIVEYGTKPDVFGAMAMAARNHGARNPDAQLRKPLTMDDYMASPLLVDPLRRDDSCLVSDGGAALILMTAKRAKALGIDNAVPILGFGHGQTSWEVQLRPELTSTEAKTAAATAFAMAGLTPADIDVAQFYDCFTITSLMALEEYGFCKPGQAGDFVRDGEIQLGGRLPINTSGGLLSETGMPGLQLVIEAVRQMRGASHNQVKGASKVVVSNQGGTMHTHAALILGAPS